MTHKDPNMLTEALHAAKPVFLYMGLFSFFINLLLLLLPIYSLQVLDRVLSTGSMETLFWLSVIITVAFLVAGILQALRSFALIKVGEWIEIHLSQPLLANTLTHAARTGARGTQNLRDLSTVKNFLTGSGLLTLFDAPWAIISLVVIFMIHSELGLITLLGCVLLLAFAWINELAMKKPLDEANETNVKNFSQLDIAMRNAETIEAMGMVRTLAAYWRKANDKVIKLQSLASYRSAVIQSVTRFARMDLQIAITGWGAYLALHNQMTSGGIIAASILAGKALAPFDTAISTWKIMVEVRKSYRRLKESITAMTSRLPGISLPCPQGHLQIQDLVYGVPGRAEPILRDINFTLNPGESVGIIGPSAAGKSTLAKLIVGAWKPQRGAVRLDGGDVCQWKREEFGKYVGYLPQDIELFSGTVKQNIARMLPDADDADIVKAAMMANAHELIMSLPDGYDTDIGVRGAALSCGQRQRIGLARAFFGEPKLLVLDEPDASLDAEGEQALIAALANARANGITTIVVTHRRSLLAYVSKLIVMKGGTIVLSGPAEEVINALNAQERVERPAVSGNGGLKLAIRRQRQYAE